MPSSNVSGQNVDLKPSYLILLAAIGALGSMAIHMIVPALPALSSGLNFAPSHGHYAVSLYLVCLGLGQVIGGARSDKMGRRPVLLMAMGLFIVGSILCVMANTAMLFLSARMVQGLGGGAAIVVARAIISDLSKSEEIAKKIAGFTTVLLLSPALSPFMGGLIEEWINWRAIFMVLGGIGLLVLVLFLRFAPRQPKIQTAKIQKSENDTLKTVGGFRAVMCHGLFWRFTAPIALATSAMYLFLSASPFLLVGRYGLSASQAGLCYLGIAATCIIATRFVGRVEKTIGAFRLGFLLMVMAGFVMFCFVLLDAGGLWTLILPMSVISFGAGLSSPSGFAGILRSVPTLEGTSSSVAGALQMLCAGFVSSLGPMVGAVLGLDASIALVGMIFVLCLFGFIIAPKGSVHELTHKTK